VGLAKDSVILLEQIRTLDKRRLKEKMGHLDESMMHHVNTAIAISFGLGTPEEDSAARAMMQERPPFRSRMRTSLTPPTVGGAVASVAGESNPPPGGEAKN